MLVLKQKIKEIIRAEGPITFARYMEMALYYPGLGYYNSPGEKIGVKGDFYTSPGVHPLFGGMLARQFCEMWQLLDEPGTWQIVEFGAGKGSLARDVLSYMKRCFPQAWDTVTYYIIETNPYFVAEQRRVLEKLNLPPQKVCWINKLRDISGGVKGCIFSNEVVDSFPVHRVRQTPEGLKEIFVTCQDDRLVEKEGPLSTHQLEDYFKESGISLVPAQTTEVNLAARDWLVEVAVALQKGFLLTIDYGLEEEELYSPLRYDGTLRCYHKHRLMDDPYQAPGKQDITAHVNFSALMRWGKQVGLHTAGLISQARFLFNLGILEAIQPAQEYVFDETVLRAILAVKKLIFPEGMGDIFKVLVQYKGFSAPPSLRGLRKTPLS